MKTDGKVENVSPVRWIKYTGEAIALAVKMQETDWRIRGGKLGTRLGDINQKAAEITWRKISLVERKPKAAEIDQTRCAATIMHEKQRKHGKHIMSEVFVQELLDWWLEIDMIGPKPVDSSATINDVVSKAHLLLYLARMIIDMMV